MIPTILLGAYCIAGLGVLSAVFGFTLSNTERCRDPGFLGWLVNAGKSLFTVTLPAIAVIWVITKLFGWYEFE